MRYVIVGAGAIGGTLGYYFIKSGQDTVLIGEKPHVEKIKKEGLAFLSNHAEEMVRIAALTHVNQVEPREGDVIILSVNTYDTEEACRQILDVYGGQVPVVCAQNTMDNEEICQKYFKRVYGAAVYLSSRFMEYGETVHALGNTVVVGAYPTGPIDDVLRGLEKTSVEDELRWVPVENIVDFKWSKFLLNMNNTTLGILGYKIADAYEDRAALDLMADVLEEAYNVVKAAGHKLASMEGTFPFPEFIYKMREPGFRRVTQSSNPRVYNFPSLEQDLFWQRGKTEADNFNGRIVQMGKEVGIPTPFSETLTEIVNEMAAKKMKPGLYTTDQLVELCKAKKQ